MKLYFVFDGAADKKGEPASEGAITAPKFAFRTKAAAERYLVKAFELVAEDEESVFLGLYATKSQAEAAAKVKAGELDMDFTSSIYPVEVLDEHVE